MKTNILILNLLFIMLYNSMCAQNFKTEQKLYSRVREAYEAAEKPLSEKLNKIGIKNSEYKVLIVGYKEEGKLEVWIKSKDSTKYIYLLEYDFCMLSGSLGPKRQQGDLQVPEGFYYIDRFNPTSSFYLSLGINYPNASDRILGTKGNLGSDIFMHGACASIGCIPITDEKIKELYIICVEAKNSGQTNIPVYIFPTKMTDDKMKLLKKEHSTNQTLLDFWDNIKTGYDKFNTSKKELSFSVDKNGKYIFKE